MPSVMGKTTWEKKACGCIKTELRASGKVVIRCKQHLGKQSKKRTVCYFDDGGIVRREVEPTPAPPPDVPKVKTKGPGFVYFARLGDLIKVGYSTHPKRRAGELSAELIGCVPGTPETEAALHSSIRDFRVRNEWYRGDAELLAIVDKVLAQT